MKSQERQHAPGSVLVMRRLSMTATARSTYPTSALNRPRITSRASLTIRPITSLAEGRSSISAIDRPAAKAPAVSSPASAAAIQRGPPPSSSNASAE